MRLKEARKKIGAGVVYTPYEGGPKEDGMIVEVRPPYVMVRYAGDQHAKATRPEDLNLLLPTSRRKEK